MPVARRIIVPPSEAELTDFDMLDDDLIVEPGRDLVVNPTEERAARRGLTFPVPVASVSQNTAYSGISIPAEADEQLWTITFQTQAQASGGGESTAPYNYINAFIVYGQGQATFTRTVSVPANGIPTDLSIIARYINISFYYVGGAPSQPALLSVGVVPGKSPGVDGYAWSWNNAANEAAQSYQILFPGPCVVGQVHAILQTAIAAGTALYPLLLDSPSGAPTVGAEPIPGGILDALFNTGDGRSYGDEFAPGTVFCQFGLTVALSTTPFNYQTPTAGNILYASAKVGQ